MSRQSVLLIGATGETGKYMLEALVEDESFDLTCFLRDSSASKSDSLVARGIKIVRGELTDPVEKLASVLPGIDTVISCLSPTALKDQIPLIDAAVQAGVKRFLPCNWGTPCPRGILALRDIKEEVHDHIFRQKLGFTIVDVGFWYQASIPRVPSGKLDGSIFMPLNDVYAGGVTPNMLIDARDVGRITARIIKDKRTLNKRVVAYGAVMSQIEIHGVIEQKTGEKIEVKERSDDEAWKALRMRKEMFDAHPEDRANRFQLAIAQYAVTKYIRGDNTPESAAYLGYLDAKELYPDFKFGGYVEFVDDLVAGKIPRPYPEVQMRKP